MVRYIIELVLLGALIKLSYAYFLLDPNNEDSISELNLPTEYHFKGEIIDIYHNFLEPFEIWYIDAMNRSRIEFYDHMIKKYYLAESDLDEGKIITFCPVSDDTETIEIECYLMENEGREISLLPTSTEDWSFHEQHVENGKIIDVWIKSNQENKTIEEDKLYVYKNEEGFDIPVRRTTKMSNWWTGAVFSYNIITFEDYKDRIPLDIVVPDLTNCSSYSDKNLNSHLHHLHLDIPVDLDTAFHRYKEYHKKNYISDDQMRKYIFEANWRKIKAHNRKTLSYKMGINQFTDWTNEELAHLTGAIPSDTPDPGTHRYPYTLEEVDKIVNELPESFDLRLEGAVPPIKNQMECGSCWAFSSVSAVEMAFIRKLNNPLLDLSEQSLVDCSWGYSNYGCEGGLPFRAFEYITTYGLPTEKEYGSYLQENGRCHIHNMTTPYKISGYTAVTSHSVNALKVALYKYGAVVVTIYATENMVNYSSGVFYDNTCENQPLNHAVSVVGYGVRDGEEYWLVRNSWGEDWGEDGYILMSTRNNNCLLLDAPYYPVL